MVDFLKTVLRWVIRITFGLLFILGWGLALLAVHIVVVPEAGLNADGTPMADLSTDSGEVTVDRDEGVVSDAGRWVAGLFDGWKLVVVPKNRLGLGDTYVDTRDWTAQDAGEHEEVVTRLLEAGKGELLDHVVEQTVRGKIDDLLDTRRDLLSKDEE